MPDDDDIETDIHVRLLDHPPVHLELSQAEAEDNTTQEPAAAEADTTSPGENQGKTSDGEQACCAIWSAELVDCAACLLSVTQTLLESAGDDDAEMLKTLLDALEDAGPVGLRKEELQVCNTMQH